jgi:hypothetical protein
LRWRRAPHGVRWWCDTYPKLESPSVGAGNAERYEEDKPLKLLWSDERGWYFPTKEELFRQQCTVTNNLRKSESLMVGRTAVEFFS